MSESDNQPNLKDRFKDYGHKLKSKFQNQIYDDMKENETRKQHEIEATLANEKFKAKL